MSRSAPARRAVLSVYGKRWRRENGGAVLDLDPLASEHKEHRPAHAERGPEVIQAHRFLHIEGGKRHEHAERDDFLKNLELAELELRMTDAVRGHLEQILEQGDPPAHQCRNDPGLLAQV